MRIKLIIENQFKMVSLSQYNPLDQPESGFLPKHPSSNDPYQKYNAPKPDPKPQFPTSYYDPPQKSQQKPSSKGPSLEEFFPAAKKPEDPKRRPIPSSKPDNKKPPKTTPVSKRNPPIQKQSKPSYVKPQVNLYKPDLGMSNLGQETIPYNLKNTNQKIDAIDKINALIGDVTDMTIMKDSQQPVQRDDIDQDTEVFG